MDQTRPQLLGTSKLLAVVGCRFGQCWLSDRIAPLEVFSIKFVAELLTAQLIILQQE